MVCSYDNNTVLSQVVDLSVYYKYIPWTCDTWRPAAVVGGGEGPPVQHVIPGGRQLWGGVRGRHCRSSPEWEMLSFQLPLRHGAPPLNYFAAFCSYVLDFECQDLNCWVRISLYPPSPNHLLMQLVADRVTTADGGNKIHITTE